MAVRLSQSNLQLGVICRKSTSGKKAFLKAFIEGKEVVEGDDVESGEENLQNYSSDKNQIKPVKTAKKMRS